MSKRKPSTTREALEAAWNAQAAGKAMPNPRGAHERRRSSPRARQAWEEAFTKTGYEQRALDPQWNDTAFLWALQNAPFLDQILANHPELSLRQFGYAGSDGILQAYTEGVFGFYLMAALDRVQSDPGAYGFESPQAFVSALESVAPIDRAVAEVSRSYGASIPDAQKESLTSLVLNDIAHHGTNLQMAVRAAEHQKGEAIIEAPPSPEEQRKAEQRAALEQSYENSLPEAERLRRAQRVEIERRLASGEFSYEEALQYNAQLDAWAIQVGLVPAYQARDAADAERHMIYRYAQEDECQEKGILPPPIENYIENAAQVGYGRDEAGADVPLTRREAAAIAYDQLTGETHPAEDGEASIRGVTSPAIRDAALRMTAPYRAKRSRRDDVSRAYDHLALQNLDLVHDVQDEARAAREATERVSAVARGAPGAEASLRDVVETAYDVHHPEEATQRDRIADADVPAEEETPHFENDRDALEAAWDANTR